MKTRVVNLTLSVYDVRITRDEGRLDGAGYFGNPVHLVHDAPINRVLCLQRYLEYFRHRMGLRWSAQWQQSGSAYGDAEFYTRIAALRGKTLGCVCKPKLCHGDVIAAWLDTGEAGLARIERELEDALKVL